MFKCIECNNEFEEPEHYIETHGLDSPPYENYYGCPCCGGSYVETYECEICNNLITNDYIELTNGEIICEDCYIIKNINDN